MTAAVLREAAARMRTDAALCGDKPTDFIPALADWLDTTARIHEALGPNAGVPIDALAVARAYLATP